MTLVFFLLGLVLLVLGAEMLVRGASRLALTFGLSPLVVGLTVVAFGTSSPELAVSVLASLRDDAAISLGNVIGSNIFNVLAILGTAALVMPLVITEEIVRRQTPIMIALSLLVLLLAVDGRIGRGEGALLAAGIVVYTGVLVVQGRRQAAAGAAAVAGGGAPAAAAPGAAQPPEPVEGGGHTGVNLLLVLAGLGGLVLGSDWLVDAARAVALSFGVAEITVGLTIVAAGTSLPELATSVVATLRGQRDIAVGNIVGSNIFNLLGILGVSALLSPSGLIAPERVLSVDLPVMVGAALLCLPVFATGRVVGRREGLFFLAAYVGYTWTLLRSATG